jgi:hypothetical protein
LCWVIRRRFGVDRERVQPAQSCVELSLAPIGVTRGRREVRYQRLKLPDRSQTFGRAAHAPQPYSRGISNQLVLDIAPADGCSSKSDIDPAVLVRRDLPVDFALDVEGYPGSSLRGELANPSLLSTVRARLHPSVLNAAMQKARYPKIVTDRSHADPLIEKTLQAERGVDDGQSDGFNQRNLRTG